MRTVSAVSVAEVMRVTYVARDDGAAIATVLAVPALAEDFKMALRSVARPG